MGQMKTLSSGNEETRATSSFSPQGGIAPSTSRESNSLPDLISWESPAGPTASLTEISLFTHLDWEFVGSGTKQMLSNPEQLNMSQQVPEQAGGLTEVRARSEEHPHLTWPSRLPSGP